MNPKKTLRFRPRATLFRKASPSERLLFCPFRRVRWGESCVPSKLSSKGANPKNTLATAYSIDDRKLVSFLLPNPSERHNTLWGKSRSDLQLTIRGAIRGSLCFQGLIGAFSQSQRAERIIFRGERGTHYTLWRVIWRTGVTKACPNGKRRGPFWVTRAYSDRRGTENAYKRRNSGMIGSKGEHRLGTMRDPGNLAKGVGVQGWGEWVSRHFIMLGSWSMPGG